MNYKLIEESISILPEYARIPIAFDVMSILDVHLVDQGLSGILLSERRLPEPYVKDYDSVEGNGPKGWVKRWDISKWGVISAVADGERIGGCVIAYDTEDIVKLEGRKDAAALWDIRVHPNYRRGGVGSCLFKAAVDWARERACHHFNVETQNINVPACRFYAKQGCILGAVNRFAYKDFPEEVELIWHKEIMD